MRIDGVRSQHRGIVWGGQGVVAAASPLAVSAGLNMLRRGGSATDAALAAAFVTTVALPDQCGVGGDAFILRYDAKTRTVRASSGSGPSPLKVDASFIRNMGHTRMPLTGIYSIAVPGAVAAYQQAWRDGARLSWQELWQPAIDYARSGVPLGETTIHHIAEESVKISASAALQRKFGGHQKPGDILYQPELARTMESIAQSQGESFYRGPLAQRLLAALKEQGGGFSGPEWQEYQADDGEALSTEYGGYRIFTPPLPSQGFMLLEALNLIEPHGLGGQGYMDTRSIRTMADAVRLAFEDRVQIADINRPQSVQRLLIKNYANMRWGQPPAKMVIDGDRFDGDTTFIVAGDESGNAVCLVHSLGHSFGSGIVAGDTGVLMNNRAGRGFYLNPGANQLAPGKRTMHTLMAWMATDAQGRLQWAGGTPGGDGQPQWNLQLLVNLIDWKLNIQEAVEAPRWTVFPGTDSNVVGLSHELRMESRFPAEVIETLTDWGYPIRLQSGWESGGGAQVIGRAQSGVWMAGSDPRVDGMAGAW